MQQHINCVAYVPTAERLIRNAYLLRLGSYLNIRPTPHGGSAVTDRAAGQVGNLDAAAEVPVD